MFVLVSYKFAVPHFASVFILTTNSDHGKSVAVVGVCAFVHPIGCDTKANNNHSTTHTNIKHFTTHLGWLFSLIILSWIVFLIFCLGYILNFTILYDTQIFLFVKFLRIFLHKSFVFLYFYVKKHLVLWKRTWYFKNNY